MIAELQDELHRLDEAIEALERLSSGSGQKRRGRPPKWMKAGNPTNLALEEVQARPVAKAKSAD